VSKLEPGFLDMQAEMVGVAYNWIVKLRMIVSSYYNREQP